MISDVLPPPNDPTFLPVPACRGVDEKNQEANQSQCGLKFTQPIHTVAMTDQKHLKRFQVQLNSTSNPSPSARFARSTSDGMSKRQFTIQRSKPRTSLEPASTKNHRDTCYLTVLSDE